MARTEAYILNELRVIAREWNTSIYEAARDDLEDYYEGEDEMQSWARCLSDEDSIKEYVKIKLDYYNRKRF